MKRDEDVGPVVVFGVIGLFLVAVIGIVIEWTVGKKSPLWSLTGIIYPLILAIIAIHYIRNIKRHFAKRIFLRGIDCVVIINYLVWGLILLMAGFIFVVFIKDMLSKLS